ncbi:3-oxoacyl-[acyl-carrier-protein] synthase III C-terminal domain-containing protein [Asticcacaulis sp. AC466]|uniref:3-oxoacyl-[acyl-carrier-protein] synthase III C-terminal domain-containing protein n=1 Tax=Asticcacaulis sp. AC466 TaxID=1282362 RepID=UPI0004CDED81|nr:3-oxoacyl-[acyl-carrier-protein] synthase III C-terminal domain-containing protein [Asticcacaulis sp. AC466]
MTYPIGFALRGFGRYLPASQQPSQSLDSLYGQPPGWTEARFGITSRPIASRAETSSVMAAHACREALADAGWEEEAFDVLVGACGVMEQPIPGTSVLVHNALGLAKSGIPCLDVNMTCLSFVAALDQVSLAMKAGRYRRALVFSSDIASAGLDYDHPEMSAIFGDGAAAVCVEACDDGPAVLAARFKTLSQGKDLAHLRAGGTGVRIADGFDSLSQAARFHMDAFGIFKAAGRHLPQLMADTVNDAGVTMEDIDTFICHQASAPGLEYMRHLVKTRPERVVDIFSSCGNQIAASLPNALYVAHSDGRLTPGSHALLVGTSAGVSLGAMVLRL